MEQLSQTDQTNTTTTHYEKHQPLAPSGTKSRMRANLEAITVLRRLQADGRPATAAEQQTLARWSSWGAAPGIFDENKAEFATEREQLKGLLSEPEYTAARRTVLNAHYTDPAYTTAIWGALDSLGFSAGRVLEPALWLGDIHRYRTGWRRHDRRRAGPDHRWYRSGPLPAGHCTGRVVC